MTVPQIEILTSILQVPLPDSLILDSATEGILDTNLLGGLVDVPLDVPVQNMSISRGKSRQLDRFNAGVASINFLNFDRRLDPLNTGSDLYGEIIPRQRMNIFADNKSIFTGVVTDWDIEYDITELDTASAALADGFTVLSNFVFDENVTPVAETPADRLDWVLDEFNYQGSSNFGGGSSTLGAYQVDVGTQALDYMFRVAQSCRSSLFVGADGTVRLIGIVDKQPTSVCLFSDDGSGLPYKSLLTLYGDELLYNRVVAVSPAGSVAVEDVSSIEQFEVSTLELTDLLNPSSDSLFAVAQGFLDLYSVPSVRFARLSVELAGLSVEDTDLVLRLDLTDQVTVRKSFSVGSPSTVDQDLMIVGIRHQIRPGSHVVEFEFEPSVFRFPFILDDPISGILDDVDFVLG